MPEFDNFKDAFRWWLENEYPKLSPNEKKTMKIVKFDFLNKGSVSDNKIQEILNNYGNLEIKINFLPKDEN